MCRRPCEFTDPQQQAFHATHSPPPLTTRTRPSSIALTRAYVSGAPLHTTRAWGCCRETRRRRRYMTTHTNLMAVDCKQFGRVHANHTRVLFLLTHLTRSNSPLHSPSHSPAHCTWHTTLTTLTNTNKRSTPTHPQTHTCPLSVSHYRSLQLTGRLRIPEQALQQQQAATATAAAGSNNHIKQESPLS